LLERRLPLVRGLGCAAEAEARSGVVRLQANGLAVFGNRAVQVTLSPKDVAKGGVRAATVLGGASSRSSTPSCVRSVAAAVDSQRRRRS
jgi:hypothetical protein